MIIDDRGRIFIQRRAADRELFPDSWDIVGGHVEPGESIQDTLRREIEEETGWTLSHVLAELPMVEYVGDDGVPRVEEDFLVRVDGDLDRPRLTEHVEWRWIGESDIDGLGGDNPGDELLRRWVRLAFVTAREIGLID